MYLPQHFKEQDLERIRSAIDQTGLAAIVTCDPDGSMEANHVPLLADWGDGASGALLGHVAKANPLASRHGANALVIFAGPDAYVSPSWYPSKVEASRVVPTWNYVAVHVQGRLEVFEDEQRLLRLLRDLSARNENSRPAPWSIDDAPADFIQRQLKGIVGFSIAIDRIEAKAKLSQNRAEADRLGVIEGLRQDGEDAVADLMDR